MIAPGTTRQHLGQRRGSFALFIAVPLTFAVAQKPNLVGLTVLRRGPAGQARRGEEIRNINWDVQRIDAMLGRRGWRN